MSTPEQKTQLATIQWLNAQYPEVSKFVIKIDNEGKRTIGGHILAKKMGLHKGASDLFIAWPSKTLHGLWVELKPDLWKGAYGKKAKMHLESQMDFIEKMRSKGYGAELAVGIDNAIKIIDSYLKGK